MVQLDDGVVDAERRQCREQVLDGFDGHRLARETGLILDAAKVRNGRRNLQAAKVAALKPDPVVSGRGLE